MTRAFIVEGEFAASVRIPPAAPRRRMFLSLKTDAVAVMSGMFPRAASTDVRDMKGTDTALVLDIVTPEGLYSA